MIERYARPELTALWAPEARYQAWLEVELAACAAMERRGTVPAGTAERIRAAVRLDPERIAEIETTTKHDVIAFLTQVEESVGEEARWLHFGMTSSDVLDTSFAMLLTRAVDLILVELDGLRAALRRRAYEHKDTLIIGRSHGMHAEPTTFGLVLSSFWDELARGRRRLELARAHIAVGKLSGAVGTFSNVDPEIEVEVCHALGLEPERVASQVVHRDRHAEYFTALALVGTTVERFAVQVRHWQRSEVGEAEEAFSTGQKGSSAMPHKRNPILSENLTGLARMLRGYAHSAMENVALWHERDISHSSVERIIGPDATTLLHFMLRRATQLVDNLVVYPERMRENFARTGSIVFSQRLLLELARAGVARQTAYVWVQRNAMRALAGEGDFATLVGADADIAGHLGAELVAQVFDPAAHLKHVDYIFRRVFEAPDPAP
ncbi:MAG: adenylosuccinate lyase [Bradymonadia bacterium]